MAELTIACSAIRNVRPAYLTLHMTDENTSLDGETSTETPDQRKLSQPEFRAEVRTLVDTAFQSGLSPEQVEDTLQGLADGSQYYFEDIKRYNQSTDGE